MNEYPSQNGETLRDHVLDVIKRGGHEGSWTLRIVEIINEETPASYTPAYNSVSGTLSRLADAGLISRLKDKVNGRRRWLAAEFYTDEPALIDEIEEDEPA